MPYPKQRGLTSRHKRMQMPPTNFTSFRIKTSIQNSRETAQLPFKRNWPKQKPNTNSYASNSIMPEVAQNISAGLRVD